MHETLKQKLTFSIGIKRLLSCLQPHCLMANSGIVLQAETVMVHLVLSSKKNVPSLFYSAVCLGTSKRNRSLE